MNGKSINYKRINEILYSLRKEISDEEKPYFDAHKKRYFLITRLIVEYSKNYKTPLILEVGGYPYHLTCS